ncbi:hypothetical protein SFRURICE_016632 [Spodoptera frugiperda]|nr:hypothetical protein SFRURICE_016632 [Spodoptera frugiperda]
MKQIQSKNLKRNREAALSDKPDNFKMRLPTCLRSEEDKANNHSYVEETHILTVLLAIKTDLFVCRVLTGCAGSVRAHLSAILAFHPIPISIEEGARNSCERETQHFPNKGTSKRTVYETEGGVHVLFTIVSPIKTKDNRVLHSLENRKEKSIEVYFAPAVVNVKGDSCSRVPREVAWCRATDKNNSDRRP